MNCEQAKPYLYDRALGESIPDSEAEAHLTSCADCLAELADLELTQKLMRQGLPEEEPARRIAFVADVPSDAPARAANPLRFWQWSFAGAALVAMLFAVLAIRRPMPVAAPAPAAVATFSRTDVDAIVAQAVAASEERQRAETAAVIQAAAQRMSEQLTYLQSTQTQVYKQSEQNRSDLRQVTALIGGYEGVRQ